jgi:hypothetical protein
MQKLFRVDSEQSIELLDELELEQDADAPMSMAVHPNVCHQSPLKLANLTLCGLEPSFRLRSQ